MAEVAPNPAQVNESNPDKMNIVQLRKYCTSLGKTGVGRMKKSEILALLNVEQKAPEPQLTFEPARQAETKTNSTGIPGFNIVRLRKSIKDSVAKCDNVNTLMAIHSMFN